MAYCTCPGWLWLWRIWWTEDWQGKPKYSEKTYLRATLSTTNPSLPDPGLNPGRRGGKPATNRLSYGAGIDTCCFYIPSHKHHPFSHVFYSTFNSFPSVWSHESQERCLWTRVSRVLSTHLPLPSGSQSALWAAVSFLLLTDYLGFSVPISRSHLDYSQLCEPQSRSSSWRIISGSQYPSPAPIWFTVSSVSRSLVPPLDGLGFLPCFLSEIVWNYELQKELVGLLGEGINQLPTQNNINI
jgi:hypothetical protein